MNNSVNSNIYAYDAVRVFEEYAEFTQGDANCTIVVVSERGLDAVAMNALCKSAEKLGFGADACAWVRLHVSGCAGEACGDGASEMSGDGSADGRDGGIGADGRDGALKVLDAENLRVVIEGIDPVSMVICDAASATVCADAYGSAVVCDTLNRVQGRSVAAFRDFEGLLHDKDSKQVAWSLLKKL